MTQIEVGTQVQYTAKFLRSISCYTGNMPFAKGQVTKIKTIGSLTLAVIDWADDTVPATVNVFNLKPVKALELD